MAFKEGDKVLVWGVMHSERVYCDDEKCKNDHFANDGGRFHYEDGPRESAPAVYVGREPGNRIVVTDALGNTLSLDKKDVTADG